MPHANAADASKVDSSLLNQDTLSKISPAFHGRSSEALTESYSSPHINIFSVVEICKALTRVQVSHRPKIYNCTIRGERCPAIDPGNHSLPSCAVTMPAFMGNDN